jgi:uncharacterized protein YuzE
MIPHVAEPVLRISYDAQVDAAYVALQPPGVIQPSVASTIPVNPGLNLDFDDEGRLVGIEVLEATTSLHPALLSQGSLTARDWRLLRNALNEVLHGPEAIEDWEFHTRTGATRDEALDLQQRLRRSHP